MTNTMTDSMTPQWNGVAETVGQAAYAAHLRELSEARGYLLELACVHAFNESVQATLRGIRFK